MDSELKKYENIIRAPRHVSKKRTPMPRAIRAAQFAPFAALSGFEDAVEESARLTEKRIEPSEDKLAELNEKMIKLRAEIHTRPFVRLRYFKPDGYKEGGRYVDAQGRLIRVDMNRRILKFEDMQEIAMDEIIEIFQ